MKAVFVAVVLCLVLTVATSRIVKKRDAPDPKGTRCIKSCADRADGDYQSCQGCSVYATCSNGLLYDNRPCAPSDPPLAWDDELKRCEWHSTTCPESEGCNTGSTGAACITSCDGKADGDYQSCNGCSVYASCSNGLLYDNRPCAPSTPPLVWDDQIKRCEWTSGTCHECQ